MGAWSHEPFGNDTAGDWAYELTETNDLSFLEATLDKVLAMGDGYLEAPDAQEALAAVEVMAKLMGRGTQSDAYTKAVDAWVASLGRKPGEALLQKARLTLTRVQGKDSELRELWADGDDAARWSAGLDRLRLAIGA